MFKRLYRLGKIISTIWQFRLYDLLGQKIEHKPYKWAFGLLKKYHKPTPLNRGEALRRALESLGPIFIKFGQVLSTRSDLVPIDIILALSNLQDNVPPFESKLAIEIIEKTLRKPINQLFNEFNPNPVASASMAQVHIGSINYLNPKTNEIEIKKAAVKVLRPNMQMTIETDLAIMRNLAYWIEKLWVDAKRLKPQEIINEFDIYLHNELDLMLEAANASQLARNMRQNSTTNPLILVPEIYFDYCSTQVLTMQWMDGVQISKTKELEIYGVDRKKLARDGVEIFFSQVFRDGFFHADMHPGNILVNVEPEHFGKYIALDFGIMGGLSAFDKHYLAHNFLAFFERDYRKVALLHVESGWVPSTVNIASLENAIRACCEPYFDKPLKDISLGLVLMRLFQTAKQFQLNIQPQLVLLQKTLLNVESLGRDLNPELDLWKTAKPILQRWVSEQIGIRSFVKTFKEEAPLWGKLLPQIPRLIHEKLQPSKKDLILEALLVNQQKLEGKINTCIAFVTGCILGIILIFIYYHWI